MAMPRGIYDYFRAKQAALRKQQREKEKDRRDYEKAVAKRIKDVEREDARRLAQLQRDEKAAERKVKQAEALRTLEAKIEARLRKELGLKQGMEITMVTRTLEIMEE